MPCAGVGPGVPCAHRQRRPTGRASAPAAPAPPSAARPAPPGCRGTGPPASRRAAPARCAAPPRSGRGRPRTAATGAPAPRRAPGASPSSSSTIERRWISVSRCRPASSSGDARTSSSSCLIMLPMRMTFAGCSTRRDGSSRRVRVVGADAMVPIGAPSGPTHDHGPGVLGGRRHRRLGVSSSVIRPSSRIRAVARSTAGVADAGRSAELPEVGLPLLRERGRALRALGGVARTSPGRRRPGGRCRTR